MFQIQNNFINSPRENLVFSKVLIPTSSAKYGLTVQSYCSRKKMFLWRSVLQLTDLSPPLASLCCSKVQSRGWSKLLVSRGMNRQAPGDTMRITIHMPWYNISWYYTIRCTAIIAIYCGFFLCKILKHQILWTFTRAAVYEIYFNCQNIEHWNCISELSF